MGLKGTSRDYKVQCGSPKATPRMMPKSRYTVYPGYSHCWDGQPDKKYKKETNKNG